jgi:hypothetical protein
MTRGVDPSARTNSGAESLLRATRATVDEAGSAEISSSIMRSQAI